uniref:Cation efflux protein transmembrane domain-containing protein n=1 Tax=Amphora coffeiformis TaxID=265554 RepID=A0A7S3L4V1_9STRA
MQVKNGKAKASERPSTEYVLNVAFWTFVGFILFQAGFAIIANSESMMADCEAMIVDAMTYLFNLCAERIKNKPFSEKELAMPAETRELKREARRLWLELIPPTISVTCLIVIVIMTLIESIAEFRGQAAGDEDDVSVPIMLFFSGANLLLDFVNVACFARSGSTFGAQMIRDEHEELRSSLRGLRAGETTALIESVKDQRSDSTDDVENAGTRYGTAQSSRRGASATVMNLNMCSAWTHVCADTLRSVSVLIAAAIATVFPSVSGALSDSLAAIAVSVIILVSVAPLIQGLIITAVQLYQLKRDFGDALR